MYSIGKHNLLERRGAETCLSLTSASKMLAGLWVSDAADRLDKHLQKLACIPRDVARTERAELSFIP